MRGVCEWGGKKWGEKKWRKEGGVGWCVLGVGGGVGVVVCGWRGWWGQLKVRIEYFKNAYSPTLLAGAS